MTLISLPQDAIRLKTEFHLSSSQRKLTEDMCESLCSYGLLNPLIVTKQKGRYRVIDGTVRLRAIKKLTQMKKLPRSLNKIPCFVTDNDPVARRFDEKPHLMTEQDLAHNILSLIRDGATPAEINAKLYCSGGVIAQARSLNRLHPKLSQAFGNGTINLAQAAAFSTVPNIDAQWDMLIKLGPFASEPEIIDSIAKGETVLELPNGDVMILPSRAPRPKLSPTVPAICHEAMQMAA